MQNISAEITANEITFQSFCYEDSSANAKVIYYSQKRERRKNYAPNVFHLALSLWDFCGASQDELMMHEKSRFSKTGIQANTNGVEKHKTQVYAPLRIDLTASFTHVTRYQNTDWLIYTRRNKKANITARE